MANLLTEKRASIPDTLTQTSGVITATWGTQSYTLTVGSVTASSTQFIYLGTISGTTALSQSVSVPSVYLAANPQSMLIGAYWADTSGAFGAFLNINGPPKSQSIVAYAPTAGNGLGTLVNANFNLSRDGKYLIGDYRFTTGTVSAANAQIPLPTNLTMDTAVLAQTSYLLGFCLNNSAVQFTNMVALPSTSTSNLYFNGSVSLSNTPVLGNASPFASGQVETGNFRVPISTWTAQPLKDL